MSTPTPRTDAAWSSSFEPCEYRAAHTARTMRDECAKLERELHESRNAERLARVQLGNERARLDDLVADINDACITLESAIADCDDYALQNTEFKIRAVRDVLLQYIPHAAMKEGAK